MLWIWRWEWSGKWKDKKGFNLIFLIFTNDLYLSRNAKLSYFIVLVHFIFNFGRIVAHRLQILNGKVEIVFLFIIIIFVFFLAGSTSHNRGKWWFVVKDEVQFFEGGGPNRKQKINS